MIQHNERHRKKSILVIAVATAIGLPALLVPLFDDPLNTFRNDIRSRESEFRIDQHLPEGYVDETNTDGLSIPSIDRQFTVDAGVAEPLLTSRALTEVDSITPYSLKDVFPVADKFDNSFAVLVYKPDDDEFVAYYSKRFLWSSSVNKLLTTIRLLTRLLRVTFPERFRKGVSPELTLAVSAGDYPQVKVTSCIKNNFDRKIQDFPCAEGLPPILHFGSVFRNGIFPSMIAMPMPEQHHLYCFYQWAFSGTVCKPLRPHDEGGEMYFGEKLGLTWEELIPQVIWRGTDFTYLPSLTDLESPRYETHIEGKINLKIRKDKSATRLLRKFYGSLNPRWQGVVHTAEAKQEAHRNKSDLPWANIRFSYFTKNHKKLPTIGSQEYSKWEKAHFPVTGDYLSLADHAKYKYHIDIGGGGGTTWTGTIQKLAMPGLLFHHQTPTKDYIHDRLEPWIHYVPVAPDLHDLKEKFDWAENNPEKAKRISMNGSYFMRRLGTPEGFKEMFDEQFLEPMRKVIEAYRPVPKGINWRFVMREVSGDRMSPIFRCSGQGLDSCERVVGEKAFVHRNY